jgi:2-methylcitrate dehydratase PrpD
MVQPLELTRQLAEFVCHTREIPDAVLAAAKVAFQDTIGVALAGSVEPAALVALDYVRETAAGPQATIWGHPVRSAPGEAAFVNAISTHALDFDDTLSTLRGHPSAPTLPVAIALAEQLRSSGRELLTAYALGVEIAGKLGQVFGNCGGCAAAWRFAANTAACMGHRRRAIGRAPQKFRDHVQAVPGGTCGQKRNPGRSPGAPGFHGG